MSEFTLERIDAVKGKIRIYKLLIDNSCEFDLFCASLETKKRESIIGSIFSTLEAYSNLQMLPEKRFKELKRPKSDPLKDYEIKLGSYRVYLFKDPQGGIVVFGAMKSTQKKDIKRLRSIKLEYINTTKR